MFHPPSPSPWREATVPGAEEHWRLCLVEAADDAADSRVGSHGETAPVDLQRGSKRCKRKAMVEESRNLKRLIGKRIYQQLLLLEDVGSSNQLYTYGRSACLNSDKGVVLMWVPAGHLEPI